jgi:DNA repair protein RadC
MARVDRSRFPIKILHINCEDIRITRQLVEAGKLMGIPVLDHVIIAEQRFTSFAERGLLA